MISQDDELRQACEAVVRRINDQRNLIIGGYDIPRDAPGPVQMILDLAKAQRAAGYEASAKVVDGFQVPIGTDATRDYRNDEQHNLALWVLAQKIREASAKEYES